MFSFRSDLVNSCIFLQRKCPSQFMFSFSRSGLVKSMFSFSGSALNNSYVFHQKKCPSQFIYFPLMEVPQPIYMFSFEEVPKSIHMFSFEEVPQSIHCFRLKKCPSQFICFPLKKCPSQFKCFPLKKCPSHLQLEKTQIISYPNINIDIFLILDKGSVVNILHLKIFNQVEVDIVHFRIFCIWLYKKRHYKSESFPP